MKKIFFLSLFLSLLTLVGNLRAEEYLPKIYTQDNKVYYNCPDGPTQAPDDLNIDVESLVIFNRRFFIDKNNVYHVSASSRTRDCFFQALKDPDPSTFEILSDYFQKDKNNVYFSMNYWGWLPPSIIEGADVASFSIIDKNYAEDRNNVYFNEMTKIVTIPNVDKNTFKILEEDPSYSMDKNNMYFNGEVLNEQSNKIKDSSLYNKLKGKIILKVESEGQAYYVSPNKEEMYFLSKPVIAFYVMREQGIGITNENLEKIPVADNYCPSYAKNCDNKEAHDTNFANSNKGKIFLQVEEHGEAWYVNPDNNKRYFLGRPTDAFNVMRNLGLGISDDNFDIMTE